MRALWERGKYETKVWMEEKIEFMPRGQRLVGRCVLAKFKKADGKDWLLIETSD